MARTVALIVGSLRKESFTRRVAKTIVELAGTSLRFETIEIGNLPLYNQDLDPDSPPQAWVDFRNKLRPLEAVLFATPEYNRSVPGVLKNAIDVGSRPYGKSIWSGKPAAVVSVSPGTYGGFGANHHLRQSLVFLDMPCMQQPEAYIANVGKAFEGDRLTDDKMREHLQSFAKGFVEWVERWTHQHAASSAA